MLLQVSRVIEDWENNKYLKEYASVFGVEPLKRLASLLKGIEVPPVSRKWNEHKDLLNRQLIPVGAKIIFSASYPTEVLKRASPDLWNRGELEPLLNCLIPPQIDDLFQGDELIFRYDDLGRDDCHVQIYRV